MLLRCLRITKKYKINEYETDSDDEKSQFEEHSELVNRACVTRSGRAVRAFVFFSTCDGNRV